MASTSSPSSVVSAGDFNVFHAIDREVYSRLIHRLGRDPAESMQVVAFWLWLERLGYGRRLVKKSLSLPAALLNELADETAACLRCVESDAFPFPEGFGVGDDDGVPLLRSLTESDSVSLRHFHEHRIGVLRSVTRIVNEVCARAFDDILRPSFGAGSGPFLVAYGGGIGGDILSDGGDNRPRTTISSTLNYHHQPIFSVPFYPTVAVVPTMGFAGGTMPETPGNVRILRDEISQVSSLINNLSVADVADNGVPPDDRTIFLTFSKGYPISESELREFFTRKIGDFVETFYMQEVSPDEQVLYARLVVRSPSIIDLVLEGGKKIKYTINGKHVWARKYVKKPNPKSPSSASPSQPNSPEIGASL